MAAGQVPADWDRQFAEAEKRIVRLAPNAFPALPSPIARELRARGCAIPQASDLKQPHNVISGEFAKPGQKDWAVLCSVQGTSSILVFWNASPQAPASIAPAADRGFLQTTGPATIGFSRAITAVDRQFILRHYQAYGGPKPPPIDHQGIDDAFVGKASVTWYFHAGQWRRLTGAD